MRSLRIIQASDIHLNYRHYNLNDRLDDFTNAFSWLGERIQQIKPDYVFLTGDFFDNPHPSNVILDSAIRILDSMNCPVLVVPGSHDSAYNISIGSVLKPLDAGGHIHYLPGNPYEDENLYAYGLRNYRNRDIFRKNYGEDLARYPPDPKSDRFNVFLFHQSVQFPEMKIHPAMVDLLPNELPPGFQLYCTGHLHFPRVYDMPDGGTFIQSPSLETCDYTDYEYPKGFYQINITGKKRISPKLIEYKHYRKFSIFGEDFTGIAPHEITEKAAQLVKTHDAQDVILVLQLEGILPHGSKRSDIDYGQIRKEFQDALHLHIVNRLQQPELALRSTPGETVSNQASHFFEEYFKSHFGNQAKTVAELVSKLQDIYGDESLQVSQREEKALEILTTTFEEIEKYIDNPED